MMIHRFAYCLISAIKVKYLHNMYLSVATVEIVPLFAHSSSVVRDFTRKVTWRRLVSISSVKVFRLSFSRFKKKMGRKKIVCKIYSKPWKVPKFSMKTVFYWSFSPELAWLRDEQPISIKVPCTQFVSIFSLLIYNETFTFFHLLSIPTRIQVFKYLFYISSSFSWCLIYFIGYKEKSPTNV